MIDDKEKKAIETPINEIVSKPVNEPEIQDVDLGYVEKKKFRIAGDYNRILELNVSDLNILPRYKEAYPKLQKLLDDAQSKVSEISIDDDPEGLDKMADVLQEIDNEMRKWVDYIFDANVSETCAPSGNMFDPVKGTWRYEHIITVVADLYTTGLNQEFEAFKKKTSKHTSKYTKKYHK